MLNPTVTDLFRVGEERGSEGMRVGLGVGWQGTQGCPPFSVEKGRGNCRKNVKGETVRKGVVDIRM